MPHVIVKFYPERDPEETRVMGQRVAQALHDTMGFAIENVSVAIQVVEKAAWMETVYEPDIAAEGVRLVKRPGYGRAAAR